MLQALVPQGGYWHCYDRSPRAFYHNSANTSVWHSGPCLLKVYTNQRQVNQIYHKLTYYHHVLVYFSYYKK